MHLCDLGLSFHYPADIDVPLPSLANLTSLSLERCTVTPAVAVSFLNLTNLRSLSLNDVCMGGYPGMPWDSVVEHVATRFLGLTSLQLELLDLVSMEGLTHLHALPHLKRLSLTRVPVEPRNLGQLVGRPVTSISISEVTSETLADVSSWMDGAASGLEQLVLRSSLPHTLSGPQLPLQKAVHLKCLTSLSIKLAINKVTSLTQLKGLRLPHCEVQDADVCSLSALTGLQSLDLMYNSGVTGAQGSMEMLARSLPQLTSLSLLGEDVQEVAQRAFQGRVVEKVYSLLILRPL